MGTRCSELSKCEWDTGLRQFGQCGTWRRKVAATRSGRKFGRLVGLGFVFYFLGAFVGFLGGFVGGFLCALLGGAAGFFGGVFGVAAGVFGVLFGGRVVLGLGAASG